MRQTLNELARNAPGAKQATREAQIAQRTPWMRPWSPTGVCGPLAFLAVYCSTSLPPGVFSFRVTLDRLQYECLRSVARRRSVTGCAASGAAPRARAACATREPETLSPQGAPAAERDALHHGGGSDKVRYGAP